MANSRDTGKKKRKQKMKAMNTQGEDASGPAAAGGGAAAGACPRSTTDVWTSSNVIKENVELEEYYKRQHIVPEAEWTAFMDSLRSDLPIAFRVLTCTPHQYYIREEIERTRSLLREASLGSSSSSSSDVASSSITAANAFPTTDALRETAAAADSGALPATGTTNDCLRTATRTEAAAGAGAAANKFNSSPSCTVATAAAAAGTVDSHSRRSGNFAAATSGGSSSAAAAEKQQETVAVDGTVQDSATSSTTAEGDETLKNNDKDATAATAAAAVTSTAAGAVEAAGGDNDSIRPAGEESSKNINLLNCFQALSWYMQGSAAFQIEVSHATLRFSKHLSGFHRFLVTQSEAGTIIRQEVVSMIPVLFFDIRADSYVLDMCAAPGSKTSQLLELMHVAHQRQQQQKCFAADPTAPISTDKDALNTLEDVIPPGLVVANDSNVGRAHMLIHRLKRLHSPCLLVVSHAAEFFPSLFVPRSGEPLDAAAAEEEEEEEQQHEAALRNKEGRQRDTYTQDYQTHTHTAAVMVAAAVKATAAVDAAAGNVASVDAAVGNAAAGCSLETSQCGSKIIHLPQQQAYKRSDSDILSPRGMSEVEKNSICCSGNDLRYGRIKLIPLLYDCVLCDVPCTADGTLRKSRVLWSRWHTNHAFACHRLQLQILLRAIKLCRVGGRVVYSTCSFNPIENEAVVAAALMKTEGAAQLVDCSPYFPSLKRRPGLSTWQVKAYGQWYNKFEDVPESVRRKLRLKATVFPPSCQQEEELSVAGSKTAASYDTTTLKNSNSNTNNSSSTNSSSNSSSSSNSNSSSNSSSNSNSNKKTRDDSSGDVSTQGREKPPPIPLPLHHCMRFLPHLNNTGGFFVAVLHKVHQESRSVQRNHRQAFATECYIPHSKEGGEIDHLVEIYHGDAANHEEEVEEAEEAEEEEEEEKAEEKTQADENEGNTLYRDMEDNTRKAAANGMPSLTNERDDAHGKKQLLPGDKVDESAGGNSFAGTTHITGGVYKETQPHEFPSGGLEGIAVSNRQLPLQFQLDFVGLGWKDVHVRVQHEQHLQKVIYNDMPRDEQLLQRRNGQDSVPVAQPHDKIEQSRVGTSQGQQDRAGRMTTTRLMTEGEQKDVPKNNTTTAIVTAVGEQAGGQHSSLQKDVVWCSMEHKQLHAAQGSSKLRNVEGLSGSPHAGPVKTQATASSMKGTCYYLRQEKLEASWRAACESLGLQNAMRSPKMMNGLADADAAATELDMIRNLLQALRESLYVRKVDIKPIPQDGDTCPVDVNAEAQTSPSFSLSPPSADNSCEAVMNEEHWVEPPREKGSQCLGDNRIRLRDIRNGDSGDDCGGDTHCSGDRRGNSPSGVEKSLEKESLLRVISLVSRGVNRALRGVCFSRYKVISAGCVAFQCRNSHMYRVGYGGAQWTVPVAERIHEALQRIEQLHLQRIAKASSGVAVSLTAEKGEEVSRARCLLVGRKRSQVQPSVQQSQEQHQEDGVRRQKDFRVVLYVGPKVMETLLRVRANATRVEWAELQHLPGAKELKEQTTEGPLLIITKIGKGGKLTAPGWRGKTQLELMIDKHTREALLRLLVRNVQY